MPRSALQEIRTTRTAITEALKAAPQAAGPIAEALQALDRLERALDGAASESAPTARRGHRNQPKTYRVEGPPGREALCEFRADDPGRPFRCPKPTYDALARVMATTTKLTKFPEIERMLKKELGELPAVYQTRVALRFWGTTGVELVERIRARYKAKDGAKFLRAAAVAWEKVPRKTG